MSQIVSLGGSYATLAYTLSDTLNQTASIHSQYTDVVEFHQKGDKRFKKWKQALERTISNFLLSRPYNRKVAAEIQPDNERGRLLLEQLNWHLADTEQVVTAMSAHLAMLVNAPLPKPIEFLTIEDILSIIDGDNAHYTFVKNKIVSVGERSMHLEYNNRLKFKDSVGNVFHADFETHYPVEGGEGRELIDDQVSDGEQYEDVKHKIYAKPKKSKE